MMGLQLGVSKFYSHILKNERTKRTYQDVWWFTATTILLGNMNVGGGGGGKKEMRGEVAGERKREMEGVGGI